ncbi:MAG: LLM class flavin-dependent oxidoreductase [Candidatus Lambdaproteobacteria bacterium]|nr:LLM class flavin-dependent oxidoreductase [Candidatus Lambdaproteobacteria bacterium]
MAHPKRVGLYVWPTGQHEAEFERALWAEEQGYEDIWFPDGYGMQDALTLAAAVAARTKRARLCTGVVPVFTRPVPVLAKTIYAIEKIAPGRLVLGLGSSTGAMVDGWYGVEFKKPVTAVREAVELLRKIMAGEKTDYQGQVFRSKGFKLGEPIQPPVPILLAAMGPKMLQMVGEVADGVCLNNFTPLERMPWALEQLDIGAKRSGRRVDDLEISARLAMITSDDPASALEFFRSEVSFYASTPIYQQIITHMGFGQVARDVAEGFKVRDRKRILAAIPDELVAKLFIWGNEAECQRRVREFFAAGLTSAAIGPQSPNPAEFQRTCEAFVPSRFSVAA